ncbi:phosphatase family [Haematococcus lacustris]
MQHLSILSCKLPTGENVYCGVTLEPYTLLKRGDQTVTVDDLPEEGTQDASAVHQLRMRWYRSTVPRGGAVCSVHPDREASMQCMVCLRHRVAQHLSYHCSVDCLKSHWHLHKDYHKQQPNPSIGENGYDGISKGTSTNVDSWVEVGRGKTYTPCTDDVGYVLKFEISVVDRLHPYADHAGRTAVAVTARVRPTPNPPARQLVQMVPMSSQHAAGRFTILSYNLLADLYAKADFASTCPAWCLHWHYRKRNLLRELLAYRADILCLQEVQSDHYTEYWAPELQKVGYIAIYKKKTTEIYTDNKYAIDGCATFFRKDRFQLVKKYEVEFNKAALSLAESFTNLQQKKAALNRLLKDNVALIAVLEAIEPGPSESGSRRTLICVANTHIHANPELNDVKLWQVHTLLKGLEKIAASADIPMLVAGDFNSLPGSPAHTLLVNGKVDPAAVHNIDPLGFLKDQKLSHSLPLLSAYAAMSDAHGAADARLQKQKQRVDPKYREPLFSIVTKEFRGTLDYILYTKNSLQPTAVLELPCESDLLTRPDEHLPNAQYSSDHIALLAEFQYLRN